VNIGLAAWLIAPLLPVGAVVIAIILGIIIGNIFNPGESFSKGIGFSESKLLAVAIALMGVNLDYGILLYVGLKTLVLVISALILTIFTALVIGRLFKLNTKFSLLLGIGSAVCGSSAIAATDKIIEADKEEVGVSIAVVNFLGTVGVFLIPAIAGLALNFNDINSGILAGNTLQAVGQAVAGGFSISESSGNVATIVKMARVLMLLPVTLILAFVIAKSKRNKVNSSAKPRIPLFIIGFAVFSLFPTLNLLPEVVIEFISQLSSYFLIIAMAAIGLKIRAGNLIKKGKNALLIGSLIFLIQIIFSTGALLTWFE
jgi:uncharacterized integral membrane protein (TIGR00698 family)